MEPGFQPELPAGPQIALRPELMGSGVPAAEVQDLPVSQSVEILHPQIGASAVVHRYVALGLIPQILAEKHRRDLLQQRGDLLIGSRGLGDDQNPVHRRPSSSLTTISSCFKSGSELHSIML